MLNKSWMLQVAVFLIFFCFAGTYGDDDSMMITSHSKGPLGVIVTDVDASKLESLGLKGGAEIKEVSENSEASKKGLKEEDIITALGGEQINSPEDLAEKVFSLKEESDIDLTYYRNGKKNTVSVHLKPVESGFYFNFDDEDLTMCLPECGTGICNGLFMHSGGKGNKGGYLGVNVKNISEDMRDYFEVKQGILVEKVLKESPAEKAGFKAGDVILSVNDREIKDYGDLIRTLNYFNPGEKVSISFSRKGSKKKVDVTLGEKKNRPFIKTIKKIMPGGIMHFKHGTGESGGGKIEKHIKIKTGEGKNEVIRERYLMI